MVGLSGFLIHLERIREFRPRLHSLVPLLPLIRGWFALLLSLSCLISMFCFLVATLVGPLCLSPFEWKLTASHSITITVTPRPVS